MSRSLHRSKKLRLAKLGRQTKWAPLWTVMKKYGKGKRIHPSRYSERRSWKRTKTKL